MRCAGCGVELQFLSENEIGFINISNYNALVDQKKDIFCKRCFNIKYYNKDILFHTNIENKNYDFNHFNCQRNILLYVVDALYFDFYIPELISISKKSKIKLIIIINKFDLLKNYNTDNRFKTYYFKQINQNMIKVEKIFCVSALKRNTLSELIQYLNELPPLTFFNVVGPSNSGKTELINSIYNSITSKETLLISSPFFKTTINPTIITLPNHSKLVDFFGFTRSDDLRYYFNIDNLVKIDIKKPEKLISYQLRNGQSMLIENIVRFDFFGKDVISFITNCNANLTIHKSNVNKKSNELSKLFNLPKAVEDRLLGEKTHLAYEFQSEKAYDILIFGLGIYRVMNCSKISLEISSKINVFIRESIL